MVEARDPFTAGHQRRVATLSCAIATMMGFPSDKIHGLNLAATIHDLGKIHIPAEILSKPGQLTKIEYDLIKTHSQTGYDIIKDVQFPWWPVGQMVLQHHERLDGSGYPQGLKGKQILPEVKILAVADVVEAMASHRPYRPSLGVDAALGEITKHRGVLYDPEAVDCCIALFRDNSFGFDSRQSPA
jgi:HD-GYP domain-containing protein (c-di-GMP phosphodiesterase class II)